MAAMNFPSSPVNGQTYTNPDTGVIYTYNSADGKWKTSVTSNAFLPLSGGTLSGALNVTDIKHASSASNNIVLASDGSATIATLNSTTITGTTIQGVIKSGTAVASTSGTAIDFTSIPSWVTRITVMFDEVSMGSVTGYTSIRLGTSAGFTTSGYTSDIAAVINASATVVITVNTAFPVVNQGSAANAFRGHAVITKITGNTWVYSSNTFTDGINRHCMGAGRVSLADTLTQIRIMETAGASFDAGTINILYEG